MKKRKALLYALIAVAILQLILAIISYFQNRFIWTNLIIAILFTTIAITYKHKDITIPEKHGWKHMPLGMKIIFAWSLLSITLNVISLNPEKAIFFGTLIQNQWVGVITAFATTIPFITAIGIYYKKFWTALLTLVGINAADKIASFTQLMLTPIDETASLYNMTINATQQAQIGTFEKTLVFSSLLMTLFIQSAIFLYIYANKQYFNN